MASPANFSQEADNEDLITKNMSQILKDLMNECKQLAQPSEVKSQPHGSATASDDPMLTTSKSLGNGLETGNHMENQQRIRRTQSAAAPHDSNKKANVEDLIPKLQSYVSQLKRERFKLKDLDNDVEKELRKHCENLSRVLNNLRTTKNGNYSNTKEDVEIIGKNIFNLLCRVPILPDKLRQNASDSQKDDDYRGGKMDLYLPGIHNNMEELTQSEAYTEVIKNIENLEIKKMMCLLSFAVFPENREVNRRMLMYWWMSEGFLSDGKPEETVKEVLEEFTEKGLIEPVEDKRKLEPCSYKMAPLVHSTVIRISHMVDFFKITDDDGKPMMMKSGKKKVCLVEGSSGQEKAKTTKMKPGDIESVFNVSERFPDFTFKWFKEMKALKVLYLGRWERTAERHIEVESPDLMENMKFLTQLKFLSLQGISRIETLNKSVCKLKNLIILDMRACYNLEKLPEKIDSLKNLIYLDISECYMIDRMPKRLMWLEKLEVLKGFVVDDADEDTTCKLIDLKELKNLKKLSLTINKKDFDINKLSELLTELSELENLKVAWGRVSKAQKNVGKADEKKWYLKERFLRRQHASKHNSAALVALGSTLMKLDLQCYPDSELPHWLHPRRLVGLKKLYIKGGTELTTLGDVPESPSACTVVVLRLKFLPKLQVEWRELKDLYFPNMELLEKYQCPRVSLCPCDGNGIWKRP